MKKRTVLLVSLLCAAAVAVCVGFVLLSPPKPYEIVGEYADAERIETDFARDSVTDAYRVGLNEKGLPAFLEPEAALKQATQDFSRAFRLIAEQNHLFPPGYLTRHDYETFGWQTVTDDESLREECTAVSRFFDIYENSYPPVEFYS